LIHTKDANRGIVQPIQHARARRKVVQLLRELKVPRVKYHAEDPARHATVREPNIVFPQRVRGGDIRLDLREAVLVREEVEEREEDGEGLLHAQEAVEGPFAVELHDRFRGRDALVGDDVLAGIVAFCWAVPEEELVEESWQMLDFAAGLGEGRARIAVEAWPLPQFSCSQTWNVDQ
jgi:hypothetical protein